MTVAVVITTARTVKVPANVKLTVFVENSFTDAIIGLQLNFRAIWQIAINRQRRNIIICTNIGGW